MTYAATTALGMMPASTTLVEMSLPVVVENGFFWVKPADRAAMLAALNLNTVYLPQDSTVGRAYVNTLVGYSDPGWVTRAVADGYAVALRPGSYGPQAVGVLFTDDARELADYAGVSRGGTHAILAAPAALVAAAKVEADNWKTEPSTTTPGLPKWAVPAAIGVTGVVALLALFRTFGR